MTTKRKFAQKALIFVAALMLVMGMAGLEPSAAAVKGVKYDYKDIDGGDNVNNRFWISKSEAQKMEPGADSGFIGCCSEYGVHGKDGTATMTIISRTDKRCKMAYYMGHVKGYEKYLDKDVAKKSKANMAKNLAMVVSMQCIASEQANGDQRFFNKHKNEFNFLKDGSYQKMRKAALKCEVPKEFRCWHGSPGKKIQNFVVWRMSTPGYLQLKKTATGPGASATKAGITYTVYEESACKTVVGTLVCQADGTTNKLKVPAQRVYYLKETKANTYFTLDSTVHTSKKIQDGKTEPITVNDNTTGGYAYIQKETTNPQILPLGYSYAGIQYTIYKSDKKTVVQTLTIKDSGGGSAKKGISEKSTKLPLGQYYVRETKTNKWFKQNTAWYSCKLTTNGQTVTVSAKDEPQLCNISLVKQIEGDVTDEDKAATFRFRVTRVGNGSSTYTYTRDVKGDGKTVTIANIPYGQYTITEIGIPDGYEDKTGTTKTPVINPGETYPHTHINVKEDNPGTPFGRLNLRKTIDGEGSLAGFKFKVTGLLDVGGTLTEAQVKETASPNKPDMYNVGEWTVNTEDLESVNSAAKKGETGDKTVKMTAKATKKDGLDTELQTQLTTAKQEQTEAKEAYDQAVEAIENAEPGADMDALEAAKDEAEGKLNEANGKVEGLEAQIQAIADAPNEIDMSVSVKVVLAPVVETDDGDYESKIDGATEKTASGEGYSVKYNDFTFKGSTVPYKDIKSGEAHSEFVTNESGVGLWDGQSSLRPLHPGTYTVAEVLTDEQKKVYAQPDPQTKTISRDNPSESLTFTFNNVEKKTPVKLKKTSADKKISGIGFTLSGKTEVGDDISKELSTNEQGEIDFGELPPGKYIIEETGWDKDNYANPYPLNGHKFPAKEVTVTGEEEVPIVVEFENKPYAQLLLTKVDMDTQKFLPGSTFEIRNKTTGETEAKFKIVANEDGFPVVNMIESAPNIKAVDNSDLSAEEASDDGSGATNNFGDNDPPTDDTLNGQSLGIQEDSGDIEEFGDGDDLDDEGDIIPDDEIPGDEIPGGDGDIVPDDGNVPNDGDNPDNQGDKKDNEPPAPENGEYYYVKFVGLTNGDKYEVVETDAPTGYGVANYNFDFDANWEKTEKLVVADDISRIRTTAVDSETGDHHSFADDGITIIDRVIYENLIPGKEYTVKGRLMDITDYSSDDPESVVPVTVGGQEVTAEAVFTPTEPNGSVDVQFTFDGTEYGGKKLVAYEKLFIGETEITSHEDPEDPEQMVNVPQIGTIAAGLDTFAQMTNADGKVEIIDKVYYDGLIIGKEYEVTGTLMDKETGEPITADGEVVSSTKAFTPSSSSGYTEVTFTFDGKALAGKKVVAFEELRIKDNPAPIAEHKDINDPDQTVTLPKIGTKADITSSKTVSDKVAYKGLIPGKKYVMKGRLMDKKTGKAIGVASEATFTPNAENGVITLKFNVSGKKLAGKSVVAFEKCFYYADMNGNGKHDTPVEVASHEDINDKAQTVTFKKNPPGKEKRSAPKTGQNVPWILIGLGVIVAACGIYVVRNRKTLFGKK